MEIFLNFRTGDQDMAAPFLHRYLASWFGGDAVFFASHSIPAGADFPAELVRHAQQCQVMLALIGPQWLTMAGQDGRPLLADPGDWVRREIATAPAAGRAGGPARMGRGPTAGAERLAEADPAEGILGDVATEHLLPGVLARTARVRRSRRLRELVAAAAVAVLALGAGAAGVRRGVDAGPAVVVGSDRCGCGGGRPGLLQPASNIANAARPATASTRLGADGWVGLASGFSAMAAVSAACILPAAISRMMSSYPGRWASIFVIAAAYSVPGRTLR